MGRLFVEPFPNSHKGALSAKGHAVWPNRLGLKNVLDLGPKEPYRSPGDALQIAANWAAENNRSSFSLLWRPEV